MREWDFLDVVLKKFSKDFLLMENSRNGKLPLLFLDGKKNVLSFFVFNFSHKKKDFKNTQFDLLMEK